MNDSDVLTAASTAESTKPLLYNYEVKCLHGWAIMIASPLDLQIFWKLAKADDCVTADKAIIAFGAIATIEFKGMFDPNSGNVVSPLFGQRAVEQAQHVQPVKPIA